MDISLVPRYFEDWSLGMMCLLVYNTRILLAIYTYTEILSRCTTITVANVAPKSITFSSVVMITPMQR